jgi:hypothetical protein
MRNSGDSPSHGTAKAAMFMAQFIRPEQKVGAPRYCSRSLRHGPGAVPIRRKQVAGLECVYWFVSREFRLMNSERFYIESAQQFFDAGTLDVTIKGWVHHRRSAVRLNFW